MQSLKKALQRLLNLVIIGIAKLGHLDLLYLAHRNIGILRGGDFTTTGEMRFIEVDLRKMITNKTPTIFDVGANTGNYSTFLRSIFPVSKIFSIEPNPTSFKKLKENFYKDGGTVSNVGFSSSNTSSNLFLYADDEATERASVHEGALNDFFNYKNPRKVAIKLVTLDDYCQENNVPNIDFLKIDTEGHELDVLKGAHMMLNRGAVKIIQFEFSMNNVVSRTFMKDFYDLLPKFDLYRIHQSKLVPLGAYNPKNEIFIIQNIVAMLKK